MALSYILLASLFVLAVSQTPFNTLIPLNITNTPAGGSFTISSTLNQTAGFSGPIGLGDFNQDGIEDLSFYYVNTSVTPNFTALSIVFGSKKFASFSLANAV
jgi:hypothetical protein